MLPCMSDFLVTLFLHLVLKRSAEIVLNCHFFQFEVKTGLERFQIHHMITYKTAQMINFQQDDATFSWSF